MKTETINTVEKTQLGNSDLLITRVGFGAWAIGGSGWEFAWGRQDDEAPSRRSPAHWNWASTGLTPRPFTAWDIRSPSWDAH